MCMYPINCVNSFLRVKLYENFGALPNISFIFSFIYGVMTITNCLMKTANFGPMIGKRIVERMERHNTPLILIDIEIVIIFFTYKILINLSCHLAGAATTFLAIFIFEPSHNTSHKADTLVKET